ncbi:DMT family transporter [Pseudohongiella sp.]|uniref:EamA domain-containing protein n=1 Tax=marine sediment metagenome TaxID=412755 RepID=A0A0F9W3G6_9ZZZZ|nr:EamA family transporter [Pseudohongiella sp.]HDZ08300.1 EamA/RhaT family transporter [Pseudohongiella sp.]HEA62576.1 EamA/RhaT family transporter [Pseudohongiella sp.]
MTIVNTALLALAALFWGVSGGIGGMLIADGWDPYVVSFYRGAIGLLFVLVWLILRPRGSGFANRRLWFWSAVAGVGVAGNFSLYFFSISKVGVSVAAPLMYCAPVFVYLLSFGFKIESPTRLKWAAIGVVIVGIVLLTRVYEVDVSGITPIGIGAGLLAGLCYAVFIFGFKFAARQGSPQAILVIAFAVLVCLLIWPADINQIVAVLSTPDWPLFMSLGVLGAGLSFILYIVGLYYTVPTVASIVAMIEPVAASLFGVLILNENLIALQILGMALILVAVTTLSVYSSGGRPVYNLTS